MWMIAGATIGPICNFYVDFVVVGPARSDFLTIGFGWCPLLSFLSEAFVFKTFDLSGLLCKDDFPFEGG